jgi:AcrR family transcriptional regulator
MARPQRISDQQIIDAMLAAMVAHGPSVSLDVVAGELGVSVPAVLKRFGTRRALMIRALRLPESPPWFATVAALPDQRPLLVQMEELLETLWGFFVEMMPQLIALRASGINIDEVYRSEDGTPVPLRAIGVLAAWLRRAFDQHLIDKAQLKQMAPEHVANAILGAVQSRFFFSTIAGTPLSVRAQRPYLRDIAQLFTQSLQVGGNSSGAKTRAQRRSA